jgi:Mn-dependent DtxR family transcriptional regulator
MRLKALEKAKLITNEPGQITLTKKGEAVAKSRVQTNPRGTDFVQGLNTSEQVTAVQ